MATKTINKQQQLFKQIALINKPSAAGTKLGVHNWLDEQQNLQIIIEKLKWFEPYSVLRQVRALLYYWANYNLKQTQNLIIMTAAVIEASGYAEALQAEQNNIEKQKLLNLQDTINNNCGN